MRLQFAILLLFGLGCASAPPDTSASLLTFASKREGRFDLYEVPLDGGGERALPSSQGDDYDPCWTADGRTLLWERREGRGANIVASFGGSRVSEVTRGQELDVSPAPSPDGRFVAFVSDRDHPRRELYVMHMDGNDVTRLTFDDAFTEAPAWSPQGDWIAFSSSTAPPEGGLLDSGAALMRVRPDGSGLERLTPEDGLWSSPSWSPDGRRLVCHGSRDGVYDLWILDVDRGRLERLTDDMADDRYPAWSPDGEWIAFTSIVDGNADIWILSPDGRHRRRLTEHASRDECPTWRPARQPGGRR